MKRCRHYDCRCARAEELARMSDRAVKGKADLLLEALRAHLLDVPCRHPEVADTDNEPVTT